MNHNRERKARKNNGKRKVSTGRDRKAQEERSKGVRLSDVALKTRVKSSKECTGNSRIRRFQKHQIQGLLEVWGSVLHRS